MRVVQFDIEGHRVEFHPYVTVLRGVEGPLREKLVVALAALASGEAVAAGMIEAHGVFLDLSEEALRVLDLAKPGIGGLDLVVRADQLPRALGPGALVRGDLDRRRERLAERVARAEAEAEHARLAVAASREAISTGGGSRPDRGGTGSSLDAPRTELERLTHEREALEGRLEAAKQSHVTAQQSLSAAEERLALAREQRSNAIRAAGEAAQALEGARTQRDPFATAAFDTARERLRGLQAPEAGTEPRSDSEPVPGAAAEVERLQIRHAELEAALLALDTVDPFPVEAALEQVVAINDVELVPSVDAERVADEWVRNEATLAGEGSSDEASGSLLALARRRLDAARAAVFDAERAVRSPEVDRLDIEALENAHEAVLLAEDRAGKRLSGERAREKLAEARAMEQAILDRIGFDTYASFVMGTSIQHVDAEGENQLEAARAELASAEDALSVLEEGVDAELAHAELLARRRALRAEAARILGRDPGDDIEWTMRHHRVEVRGNGDRLLRLQAALQTAGIEFGDERLPQTMLVDMARIWLDEQRDTVEQRDTLAQELSEVESALDRARSAARVRHDDADADESRERELDQAQGALREAEERLQRHSQAETVVAQRKAELATAVEAEHAAAAELSAAEATEVVAARAEHESAAEQERLDAELAAALDSERGTAEALTEVAHLVEQIESADDRTEREATVRDAQAALDRAETEAAAARTELVQVDHQLEEEATDDDSSGPVVTSAAAVEELEWYLVSRLAGQRSLSYAGSLPFVLDDALRGVSGDGLTHLLGRLERMSTAVQVVILTEDNEVAAWADAIGSDRAVTSYPAAL